MPEHPEEVDPRVLHGDEEELMKNLADGKKIPDGVTPAKEVSQSADPIEGAPA